MRSFFTFLPTSIALALAIATPAAAAPAADLHSFRLDNGLTVVVIENHRAPVVTQMVFYRVGATDDPDGHSGLAHFLEHLMFKETDELEAEEFTRIVAQNGGLSNASTTTDYTNYFERVASDRLELVMAMEADRMADLAPAEAGVLSERDVVLQERQERVDSTPGRASAELCQAAIYPDHPYGRPVIGWEAEVAALNRPAAMDYYRAHYAPNNAILVVAGDADPEEVRSLAERHFGPIPASPAVPPRRLPQDFSRDAAGGRLELADPQLTEPLLRRAYYAPLRRPGDQRDAAAVQVLALLLGSGTATAVLEQELVRTGKALVAATSYDAVGLDTVTFNVYLVPTPGVGLAEAEAALDAAIARFLETGPEPGQFARIRGQIRASEIYRLDSLAGRAAVVGSELASGLTLDDVADWPDEVLEVSAGDVLAAARTLLRPENSVTCALSPADGQPQAATQ